MQQPPDLRGAVVVVTGVMASGKSTVAQMLASRLPRAAHVRGDVFRRMIVAGRSEMAPGDPDDTLDQLRLRYRLAALVADEYAAAGFTAVLQDIVLGPALTDYVAALRSRPRYLVVLAPRPDVVAAREAARDKTGYVDWTVATLDDSLRHDTPRLGLWLDTSEQTAEQTVDEVLSRLAEALVP
jgi:predicted kinase